MWVLRRPEENNYLHCIPLNEPFTIGRIECSLTIVDDKSVSRKHAKITVANQTSLILSDLSSKFGSFVNGEQVRESSLIKSGDRIKFGGTTSEFILESKNFNVFVNTSSRICSSIKELGHKFGFEVVRDSVGDAGYFIQDGDNFDANTIEALLLAKYIVSPAYFAQLESKQGNDGYYFSLALMQPSPSSLTTQFPLDCWIPQRSRLSTFRTIFEGTSRFLLFEKMNFYDKILRIGEILGIKVAENSTDLKNMKFNELLIVSRKTVSINLNSLIDDPIRTVDFDMIIEALLRNDGKLIEFQTIYPEKKKTIAIESIPIINQPNTLNTSIEPVYKADESSIDPVYTGQSLTTVTPMPLNFLRPVTSISTTIKPSKFVKCHPKHRQPGIIPALIGPDQLEQVNKQSNLLSNSSISVSGGASKRRVLIVKDSWLAEDCFEEESARKESAITTIKESSRAPIPPPQQPPQIINNTTANSSKFQSSFFKNLSNKQV